MAEIERVAEIEMVDADLARRFNELKPKDFNEMPNMNNTVRLHRVLRAPACGTELTIVQEGIPEVIPIEMCYLGWQESLLQLVNLVEPEIQDGA